MASVPTILNPAELRTLLPVHVLYDDGRRLLLP